MTDRRLLQLDPRDNVLTVIATLEAGETICVAGRQVPVSQRLLLGHKVAACDIPAGGRIIKYGVPIGSATVPIAAGEHVHLHNVKSDYLPTYQHQTQKDYFDHDELGNQEIRKRNLPEFLSP
jgi:hypothetical protein